MPLRFDLKNGVKGSFIRGKYLIRKQAVKYKTDFPYAFIRNEL